MYLININLVTLLNIQVFSLRIFSKIYASDKYNFFKRILYEMPVNINRIG